MSETSTTGWNRRWTARLLGVVLLALCVRAPLTVFVQRSLDAEPGRRFVIEGDAAGYWDLALRLRRGESFEIYSPPRRVLRMPGFPAFEAACMALVGEEIPRVRWCHVILGSLTCGLVTWTGWLGQMSPLSATAAGVVAALHPALAGFSICLLSETLFGATLLLSVATTFWLGQHTASCPAIRQAIAAVLVGVCVAIACYVRPSWLLAAGPLTLWSIWRARLPWRAAVRVAVLVGVGLAATLAPWTVRNWYVTGHFVPTTLWMGASLYDGLNPSATGDSEMSFFDRENLLATMSEYDVDREYRRRAWEFVRQNPGRTIELAGIKLWRYWSPWPNAEQFRSPWLAAGITAGSLGLFALAVTGVVALIRASRTADALLWLFPLFYFCALHMVFVSSLRYRVPAEYVECLLAGIGVAALVQHWSRGGGQAPSTTGGRGQW